MERGPRIPYTPRHLAEKVLTQRASLEGERKQVTVLFADVADSSVLAQQLDPEAWHDVLDGLFRVLTEGVHRFEGTINQYTGDGVMALFGAPVAHEDHARRACYAALHVADRLDDYADGLARRGIDLGVRMGLDSGEVVVGRIGDDLRMDYTAQGPTVAVAARLQDLARPGHVCLSERTAALVQGLVTLADRGPHALKGFEDPQPVFELVAADSDRTRLEVAAQDGLTEFVGRDDELARLKQVLAEARGGQGQVLRLFGEPGVGKSRLCFEFAEHCGEEKVRLFESTCPSHGRGVPRLAVQGLLRRVFEIAPDDGDDLAREKIEHRTAQLGIPVDSALPGFSALLGVDAEGPVPVNEERDAHLVRRLVQAQSATEPSVFLMDDAQWIDDDSARLVGEMIDALGWTRTLFVLSARPGPLPIDCPEPYTSDLALGPLGREASRALAAVLLGTSDPTNVDEIVARADGNPFFTEEIVRDFERTGRVGTPASVRVLLDARIDALPPEEKHVLRVAAVLGGFADRALLARVAEVDDVDTAVAGLEQSGLIADGRFSHPLIREAADDSQLAEARRELHARAAIGLESLYAEALGKHADWIAHHWESAGKDWIARRWRQRAALRVSSIQRRGARPS